MFTPTEIERYREIVKKYTQQQSPHQQGGYGGSAAPPCINTDCITNQQAGFGGLQSPRHQPSHGFYICDECETNNGYVLGYYDYKEFDRFYYRKKSIYQRQYHYENKVKDISQRLLLSDEEQYLLYSKLMDISEETINKINARFNRKRMISIFFIIKKILEEMGCEKYHQIGLNLSKQTHQTYEKWWKYYCSKRDGLSDK